MVAQDNRKGQQKSDKDAAFCPVKAVPKRGRPAGSKYDAAIQYAATRGACEVPLGDKTARVLYIAVKRRIDQTEAPVRACVRDGKVYLEKVA